MKVYTMQDFSKFEEGWNQLKLEATEAVPLEGGTRWQSQDVDAKMTPLEIENAVISIGHMPGRADEAREYIKPNLPWAERHFAERISGVPYNPPPSNTDWPFAQQDNNSHRTNGAGSVFSHTYPERIWARYAGNPDWSGRVANDVPPHAISNVGIRFRYGDLNDLMDLLHRDPFTRQAYLPIWFPEDTGTHHGERVPCTLGYHFMIRPTVLGLHRLSMNYYMRSCDLMRHFNDDVYMAVRLAQEITSKLNMAHRDEKTGARVALGEFNMYISSLHIFAGDVPIIRYQDKQRRRSEALAK